MTTELLKNRYEFTRDGRAIIDISVESISDLFNSFDKKATFTKRELDQDFVEYVIDCVKEIGEVDFVIRITIDREYNISSLSGAEVCAEAVALSAAAEEGITDIETLVVVNRIGDLISPCGRCRELFLDYCPKAEIIVPGVGGGKVMTPQELLPLRNSLLNAEKQ